MNARLSISAGLILWALTGCGPTMSAVSTPPPTRSGAHRVDFDADTIKISRGVALAFDCSDMWTGTPCSIASLHTDDKKIAKVYPAFLERQKTPWGVTVAPRSAFVLTGVTPGETTMTVVSDSGTRSVVITVE